jgi:hypothetical protein
MLSRPRNLYTYDYKVVWEICRGVGGLVLLEMSDSQQVLGRSERIAGGQGAPKGDEK